MALVGLAVLPLLLIAVALIWRDLLQERETIARGLVQTGGGLSVALERQLSGYQVMLETLSESDLIDRKDVAGLHAVASRIIAKNGGVFISMFDRSGRQIFNTVRRVGGDLPSPFLDASPAASDAPPLGDSISLKQVFATGKPVVSDLFVGLSTGRLQFTVNVPVARRGNVVYVLNAAFSPEVITRFLQESGQFHGIPSVVVDRKGFIVGRWDQAEKFTGRKANENIQRLVASGDMTRAGSGVTLEGIPVYYSYVRSPATGWSVSIGLDRASVENTMRRDLSIGALLALTGLGLSAILALALANRMKRAIEALADAASRSVAPDLARSLRTREIVEVEKALVDAAQARESRLVAETRKEEAESANRKKDQFIAVLSHELRNPLSTLGNSVHILRHRFGDDAELRPVIEMMERQTGQLARLVNDLLDVSRINLGKVEIRAQRIDLRAVLQQALESVDPALKRKRHQLERQFPDQPVHLEGDFARLAQVFSNLLDNAAKFTPPGGRISLSLETRDGHALVRVADNGTGVDPEFLPHMFERFAQADNTLERGEAGLGVGLALALDLVRAHGGQILAESQGPGRGSVFTVRLPLS